MSRIVMSPVVTIFVLTAVARADSSAAFAFEKVTSEEGRYSVEMPGKSKSRTTKLRNGNVVYRNTVPVSQEQHFTIVFMNRQGAKANKDDPQKTLAAYRDDEYGSLTIVKDREIALGEDKVPGREYLIELDDMRDAYLRERVYLVGANLYILTVIGEKKLVNSKAADRFFESFRLTGKASTAPAPVERPR